MSTYTKPPTVAQESAHTTLVGVINLLVPIVTRLTVIQLLSELLGRLVRFEELAGSDVDGLTDTVRINMELGRKAADLDLGHIDLSNSKERAN